MMDPQGQPATDWECRREEIMDSREETAVSERGLNV